MFSGGSFSVLGEYIVTLCTQIDKMPEVKPATLSSTQRAYVPLSYALTEFLTYSSIEEN